MYNHNQNKGLKIIYIVQMLNKRESPIAPLIRNTTVNK